MQSNFDQEYDLKWLTVGLSKGNELFLLKWKRVKAQNIEEEKKINFCKDRIKNSSNIPRIIIYYYDVDWPCAFQRRANSCSPVKRLRFI